MSLLKSFIAIFLLTSLVACSTDTNEPESMNPDTEMPQDEEEDTNDDNTEEEDVIFEGNVLLTNQDEIDVFGTNNYTLITGSLTIAFNEANPSGPEIISLLPLSTLKSTGSNLTLENLNDLENIDGLNNIENVLGNISIIASSSLSNLNAITNINFNQYLQIQSLSALESFPEFNQITSLTRLRIQSVSILELNTLNNLTEILTEMSVANNNFLENMNSFQNLETIGGNFNLSNHSSLQSINGFTGLNTIDGDISIVGNLMPNIDFLLGIETARSVHIGSSISNEIFDINGLQNLTSCRFLTLSNNNLESIESLSNFSEVISIEISNCPNLTSLNGLENLGPNTENPSTSATFLQNENLTDFCGITNLVINSPNIILTTVSNGFDPTEQDIISGNCSM